MEPIDHKFRPLFAWDSFGEQLNGRLCMAGFAIGVLTEALTGKGILAQISLIFS
jgi:hypothetical protein